jgi:peptidase E
MILALGGGGFTSSTEDGPLDALTLELAGGGSPRVCLLPTAGGDSEDQVRRFYATFRALGAEPSHISLFRLGNRPIPLREHLLSQDAIYVGGGSMVNLLAVWRAHGLDEILREACSRGVALCGVSAGALCWFAHGITRSHGAATPAQGLGLLPGSLSVHWDTQPDRRERYRACVHAGMPGGYGLEDGVGLVFEGSELVETVSPRTHARAWRVEAGRHGDATVTEIVPRLLEQEAAPAAAGPVSIEEFRELRRVRSDGGRRSRSPRR